jgi:hypothetical protein
VRREPFGGKVVSLTDWYMLQTLERADPTTMMGLLTRVQEFPPRTRDRQGGVGTRTYASDWPELISITELASRDMAHDGWETGGWLIGKRDQVGELVIGGSREVYDSDRGRTRIVLPVADARAVEQSLHPGLCVLGDWPSHDAGGSSEPSDHDVRAWENARLELHRDVWIGLVVVDREFPWVNLDGRSIIATSPSLHAYAVRDGEARSIPLRRNF